MTMFCFLVTHDHVADDDLSDAGYFHIEGPKLTPEVVLDLHVSCLKTGTLFRILDAHQRCFYEGKLILSPCEKDGEKLLQWAQAVAAAQHLETLNSYGQWTTLASAEETLAIAA